jgi:hypothetical protein
MLDPRVRAALMEFHRGRCDVETTAQLLRQLRRETGCLELHASVSVTADERALLARFAELAAADDAAGPAGSAPVN